MLLKKTYREYIEPTQIRVEAAERFLRTVRRGLTYEVVPISDPYGPTITDAAIQALIVSRETLKGGDAGACHCPRSSQLQRLSHLSPFSPIVNVERANRNLAQLDIRVIDVISPSNPSLNDAGKISTLKISSSWIRKYLWEREHPATGDA
ncbi:hypothetical protein BC936DRAFT_139644 [Jimgerdemannia flammicorona]|uniref:Uncharacterized protein n=1 Tax=Jimgerdemannia flammicorona TaxID=994334 RepID=A0A433DHI3_9FUNG|nr:hypothetical protein BC936DRAFT_139644 [Jimgerdemannia flammicorona]